MDQIENLYWNLVFAYENVRVAQESLAFAQKTLSDNQKQVQIGSLAPIEVVRAQNTVAADQQIINRILANAGKSLANLNSRGLTWTGPSGSSPGAGRRA